MAKKEKTYQVSEGELDILQVLWAQQPATVREVFEHLEKRKDVGYTSILKQMQRMTDKQLVKRNKQGKVHLYMAVPKEEEVQQTLYKKLVNTAFKGSSIDLAMHALGNTKASAEEIEALQKWLNEQKKKLKK